MNYSIVESKCVKDITVHKCNFVHAVSGSYRRVTECSPGDIVCINNLNKFDVMSSLEKVLIYGHEKDGGDNSVVSTVSINDSITRGCLSLKALMLDMLSSTRITAYTKSNTSKITYINIANALMKAFITRDIKFLIIKGMYQCGIEENSRKKLLNILRDIAVSTGVIVICDHNIFNTTDNIISQENNYALGK